MGELEPNGWDKPSMQTIKKSCLGYEVRDVEIWVPSRLTPREMQRIMKAKETVKKE